MIPVFNIAKLITDLLPTARRRESHFQWLKTLLLPVQSKNTDLLALRDDIRDRVFNNGQVLVLERLLNRTYIGAWIPNTQNPVYIEDQDAYSIVYLFQDSENQPLFVFQDIEDSPVFIYSEVELSGTPLSFNVNVPTSVTQPDITIRKLIDRYRLAGMLYTIVRY